MKRLTLVVVAVLLLTACEEEYKKKATFRPQGTPQSINTVPGLENCVMVRFEVRQGDVTQHFTALRCPNSSTTLKFKEGTQDRTVMIM
jgi:hypothetical protein